MTSAFSWQNSISVCPSSFCTLRPNVPVTPGISWLLYSKLSRFRRVGLCDTPETAAHQAPPSQGFSRQEHWSVLPFPSPMHENEKWKWSRSVVSNFATPRTAAYQAPPSMGFSRQEYWSGLPLPSPYECLAYKLISLQRDYFNRQILRRKKEITWT